MKYGKMEHYSAQARRATPYCIYGCVFFVAFLTGYAIMKFLINL